MAASCPDDRLVWLRGGLCVPVEPYRLLHRLEAAGFSFRLASDGMPEIAPFDRLDRTDLELLRRWRYHVALLIQYTPDDSHFFTVNQPFELAFERVS